MIIAYFLTLLHIMYNYVFLYITYQLYIQLIILHEFCKKYTTDKLYYKSTTICNFINDIKHHYNFKYLGSVSTVQ